MKNTTRRQRQQRQATSRERGEGQSGRITLGWSYEKLEDEGFSQRDGGRLTLTGEAEHVRYGVERLIGLTANVLGSVIDACVQSRRAFQAPSGVRTGDQMAAPTSQEKPVHVG